MLDNYLLPDVIGLIMKRFSDDSEGVKIVFDFWVIMSFDKALRFSALTMQCD